MKLAAIIVVAALATTARADVSDPVLVLDGGIGIRITGDRKTGMYPNRTFGFARAGLEWRVDGLRIGASGGITSALEKELGAQYGQTGPDVEAGLDLGFDPAPDTTLRLHVGSFLCHQCVSPIQDPHALVRAQLVVHRVSAFVEGRAVAFDFGSEQRPLGTELVLTAGLGLTLASDQRTLTGRYAHETLAADLAALAMLAPAFIGQHEPGDEVLIATIAVDLLGSPLVHLAEGESDNALKSFALRLAPFAIGYAMPNVNQDGVDQWSVPALGIAAFGALAVMAIDAAFLAKH